MLLIVVHLAVIPNFHILVSTLTTNNLNAHLNKKYLACMPVIKALNILKVQNLTLKEKKGHSNSEVEK